MRKKCGGCQLQGMEYSKQLEYKQRKVNSLLSRFCRVNGIIGMENPLHYRNKVQAAFYYDKKRKRCVSGVFQSNSGKIVPTDSCMIEDKKSDEIIHGIAKLCDSFKIKPYDEMRGSGFIRHVLIRRGFKSGEIMVVIISASPAFPSKSNFVKALLKAHPEITTVVHNVNPYEKNLLLGEKSSVLYGKGYIVDELCGCTFEISPSSFYQVNPVQCENLYKKAVEYAGCTGKETLFDSYCGTGTIGIIAAKGAKSVIGVELNRDAVRDAKSNAERNGINNIRFICGDAGEYLSTAAVENIKFDTVIMDPPRAGSSKKFINALIKIKPKKIVYISCNPVTLARDLELITTRGYRVKEIQPYDMFPYTKHIETVCLLSYKTKKS